MRRLPEIAVATLLTMGCGAQDTTPEVGTNTSWLKTCAHSVECNGAGSCECGLCTRSCESDAECGGGKCGSALSSNAQCEGAMDSRICLPGTSEGGADGCTTLPITSDANLELGQSNCSAPNALLCETFDAPLPAEYSTWYGDEEVASLQDCEVARGAGALRLQSDVFGYAQTRMSLSSPLLSGPLHIRLYAYFARDLVIPRYLGLFELWTSEDGPGNKISLDAIENDQLKVNLSPFSSVLESAEGVLRRDEWVCIEVDLELSTEAGSVRVSLDGTPVIDETAVVTSPGEPFTVAVIESAPAEDSTGVNMVFDELVVATSPIGCL